MLVEEHLDGVLVFHVSRDSTAIEARERVPKKDPPPPKTPKKRGRPKKSEPKRVYPEKRIGRQVMAAPEETDQLLAELPTVCAVGTKKDAKGNLMHWRGYKLHADVGDDGIPLFCLTTSASLHDSQAAIPMTRKTTSRVTYLYELMDAAYDADEIWAAVRDLGGCPLGAGHHRHEPRKGGSRRQSADGVGPRAALPAAQCVGALQFAAEG